MREIIMKLSEETKREDKEKRIGKRGKRRTEKRIGKKGKKREEKTINTGKVE